MAEEVLDMGKGELVTIVQLNWHGAQLPSQYLCLCSQTSAIFSLNQRSFSSPGMVVNTETQGCSRCREHRVAECSALKNILLPSPLRLREHYVREAENAECCKILSSKHDMTIVLLKSQQLIAQDKTHHSLSSMVDMLMTPHWGANGRYLLLV